MNRCRKTGTYAAAKQYLLKYEGERGLRRIGLFCLAYFVTLVLGVGFGIALRAMTNG